MCYQTYKAEAHFEEELKLLAAHEKHDLVSLPTPVELSKQ